MLTVDHNLKKVIKELHKYIKKRELARRYLTNGTRPLFPGRTEWNKTQKRHISDRFDNLVPKSLLPLWKSPAGPQTIFFWAPLTKWCLVLAGIADFTRHPSLISPSQAFSLVMTGLIWCRYSMVIIPKNFMLLSVNAFVFLTQLYQLIRWKRYDLQIKKEKGSGDKKP
nr:unnamed protein product [Callosobruchus chinensis]